MDTCHPRSGGRITTSGAAHFEARVDVDSPACEPLASAASPRLPLRRLGRFLMSEDASVAVVVSVGDARDAPLANGTAEGCRALPPRGTRRLWTTLPDAEARGIRADAFARSSKGLPAYYDYRSWSATTFMLRDRAMGNFAWPWFLCVAVAAVWHALYASFEHLRHERYDLSEFERMYALIFTALGFMLVFRLSRAAVRFWDCRAAWGLVIMRGARRRHPPLVSFGSSEIHTHRSRVQRVAKVLSEVRAFAPPDATRP